MHPVLFKIGDFNLYSYGVCVALAFIVSVFLLKMDSRKNNISFEKVMDCVFWVLIGGFIGGRLLHVLVNLSYYTGHPSKILAFRDGGMAIHGSIFAGFFAGLIFCRKNGLVPGEIADLFAPYVALGQAIGRMGCFMNGCCYGRVVTSGLRVQFPSEIVSRIPVQLYFSAGLLLIFGFLFILKGRTRASWFVFLMYTMSYSVFRFFMEFLRSDNPAVFWGFKTTQIISILVFLVSMAFYCRIRTGIKGCHGGNGI